MKLKDVKKRIEEKSRSFEVLRAELRRIEESRQAITNELLRLEGELRLLNEMLREMEEKSGGE